MEKDASSFPDIADDATEAGGAPPAEPFTSDDTAPQDTEFDLAEATGGRYVYIDDIRTGGMGRVIRARDTHLERIVAVKILRASHMTQPLLTRRFVEEAKITANLIHPGIVPVHDVGRDSRGRHFFVMEHVEGETLAELLAQTHRDRRPRPTEIYHLAGILRRVCETMAYAHHEGVIHRDLKPSNIMVGAYGEVLVMDWGLARRAGAPAPIAEPEEAGGTANGPASNGTPPTHGARVSGTPRYMSPEQAAGDFGLAGPRSDIFSLGVILYEILTGEKPFTGESVKEILDAVRAGRRPSIRETVRRKKRRPVPRGLVAICEKALAVDPARRYPTAQWLTNDLEAFFENRAITAFEEPFPHRIRRWTRRYPTVTTTFTVAALAVLLMASEAGIQYYSRHRLVLTFRTEVLAARQQYRGAAGRLAWLKVQYAREEPGSPVAQELDTEVSRWQTRRLLAAHRLWTAMKDVFAVQKTHPPEEFREFRTVWLEEMIALAEKGDSEYARSSFNEMQSERHTAPWWCWEPDEFPRVEYLRALLRRSPGQGDLRHPGPAPIIPPAAAESPWANPLPPPDNPTRPRSAGPREGRGV